METLLGNGASFEKDDTKDKLGKNFDHILQTAAKHAINGSASYGFWNFDHLEVFDFLEFVPLYDEYTGELMAGIRYWQIDSSKPLCVVLFEPDGLTEFIREKGKDIEVRIPKRAYKNLKMQSVADGEFMTSMGNYESLPIVPMYNENKQSAIVGKQNTLDAYDLTLSQMVNNVDDGNFIYWILKNCGGMDAVDDERFISQLKVTHMAHADGDSGAGAVCAHECGVHALPALNAGKHTGAVSRETAPVLYEDHFPVSRWSSPLYFRRVASPPRRCRSALFCSRMSRTFSYRSRSISRRRSVMSLCTVVLDTPKRSAAARTVALFRMIYSASSQARSSMLVRNHTTPSASLGSNI